MLPRKKKILPRAPRKSFTCDSKRGLTYSRNDKREISNKNFNNNTKKYRYIMMPELYTRLSLNKNGHLIIKYHVD